MLDYNRENISKSIFILLKQEFLSEFPHYYESSQTRYVLFHLLMNRIVRYTYSRHDILSYGKKVFDTKLVHMFYWYDSKSKFANWGDVFGPFAVEKLSPQMKVVQVVDFQRKEKFDQRTRSNSQKSKENLINLKNYSFCLEQPKFWTWPAWNKFSDRKY